MPSRNNAMNLIHCKDCNDYLPEDEFSKNERSKTGRSFYCKRHAALRQKQWKKLHPEKIKEWKKDYLQRTKNSG